MTPYNQTRLFQIDTLLQKCWNEFWNVCHEWTGPVDRLSDSERRRSKAVYDQEKIHSIVEELLSLSTKKAFREEAKQSTHDVDTILETLNQIEDMERILNTWFPSVKDGELGNEVISEKRDDAMIWLTGDAEQVKNALFRIKMALKVPNMNRLRQAKMDEADSLLVNSDSSYKLVGIREEIESYLIRTNQPVYEKLKNLQRHKQEALEKLHTCMHWQEIVTGGKEGVLKWLVRVDDKAVKNGNESGIAWNIHQSGLDDVLEDYQAAYAYHEFIKWLDEQIGRYEIADTSRITHKKSSPKLKEKPVSYKSFADLFFNPDDIAPCVDVLRGYRPEKPVLGEGLNWVGAKGPLVAWIEGLEALGKIKRISNRKELVRLLNAYFNGLNMGKDASIFSKIGDADIKNAFIALIPK